MKLATKVIVFVAAEFVLGVAVGKLLKRNQPELYGDIDWDAWERDLRSVP